MTIDLGIIRQTAFVVDNAEAVAMEWATRYGVGPWFVFETKIADVEYRGTPAPMHTIMALAQSGDQQLELIQPLYDGPSLYHEFIDAGGSGVHHVCYWADVDAAVARLTADGAELVQHGTTANGDKFAYTTGAVGIPYVEVVDPTGGSGAMAAFFAHIAAAADGWDGTDPIRGS